MKTSLNWLKRYTSIPWTAEQLADALTLAGLEVEDISHSGTVPDGIVVARIAGVESHPNADRLQLCRVDVGGDVEHQIICGASNCAAGKKVALATLGVTMPDGMVIRKCKIRGVESSGMLCSLRELGLGDEHDGIWILPEDATVGQQVNELVEADAVIDWEVTPNRPDWLSHFGIAREIAALTGESLEVPDAEIRDTCGPTDDSTVRVTVASPELCDRYTAREIRDVRIGPSPEWMQRCLQAVGLRPINNVVDITNFVLLECGQPLHAFDLDRIADAKLDIRRATSGEIFVALNGQSLELNSEHLVVADGASALALAGVIGGESSEITDCTVNVLLESAAFDASNIRKTSKELGVSTDSSYRFERGVDVQMVEYASRRAATLMCELAGGRLSGEAIDIVARPAVSNDITCRFSRVNAVLGVDISPADIVDIFSRLRLPVRESNDSFCSVCVPSFRLDLTREVDLIEEVARLYGLNRIPSASDSAARVNVLSEDTYLPVQDLRQQLIGLGLNECVNYSLIARRDVLLPVGCGEDVIQELSYPLSSDQDILRPGLINSMLDTVSGNLARGNSSIRLFEIGRIFRKGLVGCEPLEICVVVSGARNPERFSDEREALLDFYDLRGVIDDLMDLRRIRDYTARPHADSRFRSGVCAEISAGGEIIGTMGEISGQLSETIRAKHPVFIALLRVDRLLTATASTDTIAYKTASHFPAVTRDVAFSADEALMNQTVVDHVIGLDVAHLERIDLTDIYRDAKVLGDGRKSMVYTITYRASDRTLTDDEVNVQQEKIRHALIDSLPIQIR